MKTFSSILGHLIDRICNNSISQVIGIVKCVYEIHAQVVSKEFHLRSQNLQNTQAHLSIKIRQLPQNHTKQLMTKTTVFDVTYRDQNE